MMSLEYAITISSEETPIVAIDSFRIEQNHITFLFGESGIGKSLLSKALYGIIDPDRLVVRINGQDFVNHLRTPWLKTIRNNSFFVFQEPSSHLNPLMRISEQMAEGSLAASTNETAILSELWNGKESDAIQKIMQLFPKPFRPSGGEKQRVHLAMAFKKLELYTQHAKPDTPSFFVFDEPTGSLDNRYRNLFLSMLFEEFRKKPFTALLITHDYSMSREIATHYQAEMRRVHFKELTRKENHTVELRDFSPQDYETWLLHKKRTQPTTDQNQKVLFFEPEFEIFGRKLAIYSDESKTQKTPLILHKGELAFIKAGSGVGKTTLAKIILGLFRATRFSMTLCSTRITETTVPSYFRDRIWGKKASMVFQHADESLNLAATVYETFAGLPFEPVWNREQVRQKLSTLFQDELSQEFLDRKVNLLSGGQKQRLNLLRTLALKTDLVILDEPLNGLDFESTIRVTHLIEETLKTGCAILVISHNEEIFEAMVPQNAIYHLGEVDG